MSVYKPKNSPYFHFDFVRQGARIFGSTGCKTKREALAYENRERQKLSEPKLARPPITLDEACGLYDEHVETMPCYPTVKYMMVALLKGLGKTRLLSDITQRDLQSYLAKRRAGRSNASVNREMENARAIWTRCSKARFDVGEVPDWKSLRLKVERKAPRELAESEEGQLFTAIRDDLVPCMEFLFRSGWRRGEVIGLRWSDLDLNVMQATTRVKGGEVVKRPLTASLTVIIANQPKVGPFVFTYVCQQSRDKRRKGERYPMTATVLRAGRAAWAAAGVEGFRIHDLRHTRGTRIVRATGSLAAAKEALKHKNISTTLRYAHVLDDDVRDALDASEDVTKSRPIPEVGVANRQKG